MLVAGCTSSSSSDQRAGGRSSVTASATAGVSELPSVAGGVDQVSCAAWIASGSDPPDNYRVVVQGLAVPTTPVLQANETGETDPAIRLFAKWGLIVRTGAVVDLRVAPGWEDRVRIKWGSSASPGLAVHVPACPKPSGQSQWLHFAGGTWVAQPACVPLVVRSQGQEAQVRLGVGMACDGAIGP